MRVPRTKPFYGWWASIRWIYIRVRVDLRLPWCLRSLVPAWRQWRRRILVFKILVLRCIWLWLPGCNRCPCIRWRWLRRHQMVSLGLHIICIGGYWSFCGARKPCEESCWRWTGYTLTLIWDNQRFSNQYCVLVLFFCKKFCIYYRRISNGRWCWLDFWRL